MDEAEKRTLQGLEATLRVEDPAYAQLHLDLEARLRQVRAGTGYRVMLISLALLGLDGLLLVAAAQGDHPGAAFLALLFFPAVLVPIVHSQRRRHR